MSTFDLDITGGGTGGTYDPPSDPGSEAYVPEGPEPQGDIPIGSDVPGSSTYQAEPEQNLTYQGLWDMYQSGTIDEYLQSTFGWSDDYMPYISFLQGGADIAEQQFALFEQELGLSEEAKGQAIQGFRNKFQTDLSTSGVTSGAQYANIMNEADKAAAHSGFATYGSGVMPATQAQAQARRGYGAEVSAAQSTKTLGIEGAEASWDQAQIDYQQALMGQQEQIMNTFWDDIIAIEQMIDVDSQGGGGSCFHKNSKVILKDGTKIKVSEVKYGDELQAMDTDGSIIYSKVVKDSRFNTKESKTPFYYVIIKAGDETLRVTCRHRIFVNGINKTIKAKNIYPTMEINIVKDGELTSVKVDSIEHKMLKGKYDVFTECGSVIVDNIVCTIFDGPLPHKLTLWAWRIANKFKWFYDLNYKWWKPLYRFTQVEPN